MSNIEPKKIIGEIKSHRNANRLKKKQKKGFRAN